MITCGCSGIQRNICSCAFLKTARLSHDSNESNIIFVPTRRRLEPHEVRKPGIFSNIVQSIYDVCVGYNIRYCALSASFSKDKMIKHAFKDLLLLLCFLVTNTIVFLTLLTRIIYHTFSIIYNFLTWTQRILSKKLRPERHGQYNNKKDIGWTYSDILENFS